jgi:hypothetical protein
VVRLWGLEGFFVCHPERPWGVKDLWLCTEDRKPWLGVQRSRKPQQGSGSIVGVRWAHPNPGIEEPGRAE